MPLDVDFSRFYAYSCGFYTIPKNIIIGIVIETFRFFFPKLVIFCVPKTKEP